MDTFARVAVCLVMAAGPAFASAPAADPSPPRIVVAFANEPLADPGPAGTTGSRYGGAGYRVGQSAQRQAHSVATAYGLREVRSWPLVVAVAVVGAEVDPLRSIRGPNPAPATVVVGGVEEGSANESEAIEATMEEEAVMDEGVRMHNCGARKLRRQCGTRHRHSGQASRAHVWTYAP